MRYDPTRLTNNEKAIIDHALVRLRDLHRTYYEKHSNPKGDVAQHSKKYAELLDQLRGKVLEL